MSNSSTSLVQYPLPYKAVDGCLFVEKANKNGTTTKKLCNFLPYLKYDINVDDGVELTRTFRIAGVHESGRLLPEIEVTVKEFGKMDWVLERWGAECVIEPGNSNRENICCAILKTVGNAEKKNVYRTTGWQLIDGKWEYLLPNDGKHDVRLFGKLRHYEMATHWSDSDLKTVWSMMKDRLIATKAIIWTLIAFVFLTPLNEFFRQVFYEPKFVLCLIGKTGSRKSTLAALFLSFFGRFSGTDLPLSFSDTLNSILTNINTLKDVLTCIDDFHPGTRAAEKRDTNIAQGIDRAFGDRIGKGRLTSDCTPMEARPPQGNAIVTGETVPDVGESGTARTFTLEIKRGDVDLKNLSYFQSEAKNGTLMSCLLSYTEWIKGIYLHNESAQGILLEDLRESFEAYRDEFIKTDSRSHGRVSEIVAWLTIGMKYFLEFLYIRSIIEETEKESVLWEYREILFDLAKGQSDSIEQDNPVVTFIQKLYSLLGSGQAVVLDRTKPIEYMPVNFIGYEDEKYYCLNADMAHRAVVQLCREQGESFTLNKKSVIKALAEEGLLDSDKGKNVKSVNVYGKGSIKLLCIDKEKADQIIALSE